MTDMNQTMYALIVGIPSFAISLLLYLRSRKVDKVAEQAGVTASSQAGTAQIIEGLNLMLTRQAGETQQWRDDFRDLRAYTNQRIDLMTQRLEARELENDHLKSQLALMIRRFGEINGNGNGILTSK